MKVENSKGFTLIELIVVIVILGILAAVAAPKFMDLQSDARKASLQGMVASIRSAVNMVKSKAMIQNIDVNGNIVELEIAPGKMVVTRYGYPYLVRSNSTTFDNLEDFDKKTGMGLSHIFALDKGDWKIRSSSQRHGFVIWPNNGSGKSNDAYSFNGTQGEGCYLRYGFEVVGSVSPDINDASKESIEKVPIVEFDVDGC